jgi:phosphoketolase
LIACRTWVPRGAYLKQLVQDTLIEHKHDIAKYGRDLPEIRGWMWNDGQPKSE